MMMMMMMVILMMMMVPQVRDAVITQKFWWRKDIFTACRWAALIMV